MQVKFLTVMATGQLDLDSSLRLPSQVILDVSSWQTTITDTKGETVIMYSHPDLSSGLQ